MTDEHEHKALMER